MNPICWHIITKRMKNEECRMKNEEKTVLIKKQTPRWPIWFLGIVFVCALIVALRAMAVMSDFNALSYRLSAVGWGKFAGVIVQNKISALWHAAFMTVCAGVFIWLYCQAKLRNQFIRNVAPWLLVAIVAADAFMLSRHYVKTMPLKAFAENDVIRIFKSDMPERRVALINQDGFYNRPACAASG